MTERFVVIGGNAAGMSAASKAKRDAPDAEVIVLERGDWVAYGACGIPYYVEDVIHDLEDLVVVDPEGIAERGIDLRRHQEVVDVDPERRVVTVDAEDGRHEVDYDHLLLATGGRAAMLEVPGIDLEGIFGIRNLDAGRALRHYIVHDDPPPVSAGGDNGSRLKSYLEEVEPSAAAIVGANKIGVEMAEAFSALDLNVHVVDEGGSLLPLFGADAAEVAENHLREADVELHLDTGVDRFVEEDGRVTAIETDAGTLDADVVLVDVGVEPNVELAVDAGIGLGPTGAIATDEYGRTDVDGIYAAGDCAEKHHVLADEPVQWPFALAANRSGRSIGATVAGTETPVCGVVGTLVMKAFSVELARTGLLEEGARAAGFDPVSRTISTITRAHYYPGWSRMVVHAVADRDSGRLLGATLAAEEGAAHRINAVATALETGLTVTEVGNLDFGYAPPIGPVWDPVLTVAKVLDDDLRG